MKQCNKNLFFYRNYTKLCLYKLIMNFYRINVLMIVYDFLYYYIHMLLFLTVFHTKCTTIVTGAICTKYCDQYVTNGESSQCK